MSALVVGPFVLAGDRLAMAVAMTVFVSVSSIMAFWIDGSINRWSGYVVVAGLAAARFGFVTENFDHFYRDPLRIFKVWQGGFEPAWGIAAALMVSAFYIRCPRVIIAGLATLTISSAAWLVLHNFTTTAVAQSLPPQTFAQLQGPPIALGATDGRAAVINIWATWCPPCRHELPMFAEAAAQRKDVVFFFVNAGESASVIQAYLASEHLELPHVLLDPTRSVTKYFGLPGYPATLFVRPDGTVAVSQIGEVLPEHLDNFIGKANRR